MRISDWSSDVCSSDLEVGPYADDHGEHHDLDARRHDIAEHTFSEEAGAVPQREWHQDEAGQRGQLELDNRHEHLHREDEEGDDHDRPGEQQRSEEHTSELQSLMRISYAVFCLKKKKKSNT